MSLLRAPAVIAGRLRYSTLKAKTLSDSIKFCEGQQIHGYRVIQAKPVPELYLTAILLEHEKTKAQHLHISRDDGNNVFGVSFRTTPLDDTGVPHILEHTALCGSKHYPVRDPFFKMLNRSLSTFMNAFTANDWTMYPFSTQNPQDYQNLMSVYLDAAFFPNLSELDFRQEGWRLEHEEFNDKSSPIAFKGVVFNEMKGVFSDSQNIFAQKAQNFLLPSHTYGKVSGGDPISIPDLTWQQLLDFHKEYYHPSNSRFYTYGNFPLEDHLEFIDKHALSKFNQLEKDTSVPTERKWSEPRSYTIECAPNPMAPVPEKQTTTALCYLLNDVTDEMETFILSILGSLLVSGEKAPFYKSLIESQLGSDFAPVLGYDTESKDATFSIGLQGISSSNADQVKDIIEKTIDEVIQNGFEQERIDAILHKIELSQKHVSSQFGLNLAMAILGPWIHDGNPITNLQIATKVEKFKQMLKENPRLLQDKVKYYLKDNTHRLTLTMSPEESYDSKLQKQEKEKLDNIVSGLSDQDRADIYQKGLDLAAKQNSEEDISCLPTLQISDIPRNGERVDLEHLQLAGVNLQRTAQPTNGITYLRMLTNVQELDDDLKLYLPLFCNVVTRMGTERLDYSDLSQEIDLYTGGLNVAVHSCLHPDSMDKYEEAVSFSSYCLDRNVEKMFQLWSDIFNSLRLRRNEERLPTLIKMCASDLSANLIGSGHAYAMSYAASSLSPFSKLSESMGGITQVALMKQLAAEADVTDVFSKLERIAESVLCKNNMRCSLISTPENLEHMTSTTEHFLEKLKQAKVTDGDEPITYSKAGNFTAKRVQTLLDLPQQVNYVARAIRTVPFSHRDFPSLQILARVMTNKFLHREIREKGGAYGGGAVGSTEMFKFYSYRDPNTSHTLEKFNEATSWAQEGNFSQQDIDEAKLTIFSKVDNPVPPGKKGQRQFAAGINDLQQEEYRKRLFAANKDDLVQSAGKYLVSHGESSSDAILGRADEQIESNSSWTTKQF